ncbi:hypothetical protein RND71_026361 [Anisodus tanguticus]|uniref:Uncharacterized protein n=1 Tax=Anisodus tanguticus TaxID=243964 RepID=A0AAE1RNS2_9SOLA|nr:hypothetical protein RND71_026361 [Anisodus tanguticus]
MVGKDWLVVLKTSPRDLFNMPEKDDNGKDVEDEALPDGEAYQQEEVEFNMQRIDDQENDILVSLHRDDVEPQTINCTETSEQARTSVNNEENGFINDNHVDLSESEESEEELLDDIEGEDIDMEDSDMD